MCKSLDVDWIGQTDYTYKRDEVKDHEVIKVEHLLSNGDRNSPKQTKELDTFLRSNKDTSFFDYSKGVSDVRVEFVRYTSLNGASRTGRDGDQDFANVGFDKTGSAWVKEGSSDQAMFYFDKS